ncbi:hypothetical protein MUN88_20950 [Gracilibacillus caseinilyticus]|uniref:Uncharacterized protein n=1 Tax=Gracilibacillus caseinilyticus TaxID=2932256 RepID=A0ABY4EW10_9BACI|nr:hypothetical protein [Gracilibacillus caseinilyticus]UOQ48469.1 hypothetical protein MUN88_20950 [Gracilibacillus caseinilyticus]
MAEGEDKMTRILIIIDPLDPGLSIEHQLYLIRRHTVSGAKIYFKLLANHPELQLALRKIGHLLTPLHYVLTESAEWTAEEKDWHFLSRAISIPAHIRKAQYNFPSLALLYWQYVKDKLAPIQETFDEAISLSGGLTAFYIDQLVTAQKKIYYEPVRKLEYRQGSLPVLRIQDRLYTPSLSCYHDRKEKELHNCSYYNDSYYPESLSAVANLEKLSVQSKGIKLLIPNNFESCWQVKQFSYFCYRMFKIQKQLIWYIYGDNQFESLLRQHLATYQILEQFIFIGQKANLYPYVQLSDLYIEWNQPLSMRHEAELLQKPIVKLDNNMFYKKSCAMTKWLNAIQIIRQIERQSKSI